MTSADISAMARMLFEAHGASAIAQAARKADSFGEAGDEAKARDWRRIEAVLREMRGPRQT